MRAPTCWTATAAIAASDGASRPLSAQWTSSAMPASVIADDHAFASKARRVRRRAEPAQLAMRRSYSSS